MAGVVAVEITGGPEVPFHPGREVSVGNLEFGFSISIMFVGCIISGLLLGIFGHTLAIVSLFCLLLFDLIGFV